ncbi:MAG: response regulator transcription factor [Anaerolineaceae bacterium]|nr:response regulator transcription factor [Anaerolineaceae bacterium]
MIRILLVEDHHLVRKGIKALLEKVDDLKILGEAENGLQAVEMIQDLNPDVIIMDINMPKLNGIQAAKQIREINSKIHIVILSMYVDDAIVRQAFEAGVEGYLLKRSLSEELVLAIKSVSRGDIYLSPGISRAVVGSYLETSSLKKIQSPLETLTARELQVMQLISEGNTTKTISSDLGVSVKTVEKHRTSMMTKLNLHDIAGVVRFAIRHGIIFLDED